MAQNSGKRWSMDELRVLAAIYFNSDFSIGDDGRPECQMIAACFSRAPASVDRQWRNIAALDKGRTGYNIGELVEEAVQDYLKLPDASKKVALSIASRKGWQLDHLIVGERQPVVPLDRLKNSLSDMCGKLKAKRFSTGSQGFFTSGKVNLADGVRYQSQIMAVVTGSKKNPKMEVLVSSEEVASAIRPMLEELETCTFKTGSTGFVWDGSIVVANKQKCWSKIQAVRIGSK